MRPIRRTQPLLPLGLSSGVDDASTAALLEAERARAERRTNAIRIAVLGLLALAAAAYAPYLTRGLTLVNAGVLAPMLLWAVAQHVFVHRRRWWPALSTVNAIVDVSAVTMLLLGYGLVGWAALVVRSPIWVAYFVILGARPFMGSARRAAFAAVAVVVEYGALVAFFAGTGRLALSLEPLAIAGGPTSASALDEAAKLLLLGVGGWVATYATAWNERTLHAAATALRASEAKFRAVFDRSAIGIALLDAEGRILDTNGALEQMLGYAGSDLCGKLSRELSVPEDAAATQTLLRELTAGVRDSATFETRRVHTDGQVVWTLLTVSRAEHLGGGASLIEMAQDITERKALEAQLTHQALHDPLTGLANRALFRDRVEHALARASRSRDAVSVLFLDLDDFKTVNDSLGHGAGDRLLTAVAARLRNATRGCDTVARLGGDEFAVLLELARGDADAIAVAERVESAFRTPLMLDGRRIPLGVSIGIARANDADGAEELLRNADVAMYTAKSRGKGRHAIFTPAMHAAIVDRVALEADLRRAIERMEFRLHYQPIVELASGQVTGVEALLRWEHPERGLLSPASFIPLAEETGLIVPLGRWVIREACRQSGAWHAAPEGSYALTVTVNLSGRQLKDASLPGDVGAALRDTGLEPGRLVLEITESMITCDDEATLERLRELKALGVRLAIDDFGTGYSSLSYLQRLPVDVLKIDKAFVDRVAWGGNDGALARTIIALGDTLALRTVAEGIEDEQQRAVLRELGCEFGQGYLFAQPLTAAEVGRLLQTAPSPAGRAARHAGMGKRSGG